MRTLQEARKAGNCYIIAEAGVNHNSKLDLALQLVDAAVDAGADCVKFQTYITEDDVLESSEAAIYQKENIRENSQFQLLKKLELPFSDFVKIKNYCDQRDIQFLSTPFELKSFQFLNSLNMPFWKVPSSDIDNYPLLEAMAKTKLPIVLSTGMSDLKEIEEIMRLMSEWHNDDIIILHCNTQYPTSFHDVNLRAMLTLQDKFNCDIGYSDHTLGINVPIAAVALGAKVIEKHFTLNREMEGPDHKASLEPDELKAMVEAIRQTELALGDAKKTISDSARQNQIAARKSIYATKNIEMGDVFNAENIACKRPAGHLSPLLWPNLIGKKAKCSYFKDEAIREEEINVK